MGLDGKTALVTGAAQGIGYAIAERLGHDGAAVGIADLNKGKADEAAQRLCDAGVQAVPLEMNVADPVSVGKGLEVLTAYSGPADILVNNAGVYLSSPLLSTKLDQWNLALSVMLTGPMLASQAVVPHMIDQKWGRIVNLGSLLSNVAFGEDFAYATAKTGIVGFSRSLAAELAEHNICVNTVCPGNILTDMLRETGRSVEKREGLEAGSWLARRDRDIPLGRLGDPADLANATSFLCSDAANYITGQSLHINGGLYHH